MHLYHRGWSDGPSLLAAAIGAWARLIHPGASPATGWTRWLIPGRITLRPPRLHGATFAFDPRRGDTAWIVEEFLDGAYDPALVPWTPDLVIDAGAHIGGFSLIAVTTWPSARIEAFEPQPANRSQFRAQSTLAPVSLHAAAVGLRDGETAFSLADCGSVHDGPEAPGDHIRVALIDLPAFLRSRPATRLVLKLDVEGAERELLPALLPAVPRQTALYFETHGGEDAWTAARTSLESAGFSVTRFRSSHGCVDGFALRG